MSFIYFYIFKKLGLLRVPLVEEIIGIDVAQMGADAPDVIVQVLENPT